jgi:hypothetical protein
MNIYLNFVLVKKNKIETIFTGHSRHLGANVGRRLHGEEHVSEVFVFVEHCTVELKKIIFEIL